MKNYDVIIVGAGAAGLMCAITAAKRGKSVLVVEHARKVGRKILMSGGGRCNFTNMYTEPENFLSANPHFCKSALSQYTQWDFIDLVNQHGVAYHEKTLGQLFCDNSSKDIVQLLLKECHQEGVTIEMASKVTALEALASGFSVFINQRPFIAGAVVVATGGLSIPSMGPHGFGYQVAEQFGLPVLPTSAALVPFVMNARWQKQSAELSGISFDAIASNHTQSFKEAVLLTHKGLSGPAILQISSYWQPGESITLNLAPEFDLASWLIQQKQSSAKSQLKTVLSQLFSKRLAAHMLTTWLKLNTDDNKVMAELSDKELETIGNTLNNFTVYPETTEGYKTAEVTLGGVDTHSLSSKTMMCNDIPGLFFVGEAVDVTGHLGGYNFQWAWSSGWVAGQNV